MKNPVLSKTQTHGCSDGFSLMPQKLIDSKDELFESCVSSQYLLQDDIVGNSQFTQKRTGSIKIFSRVSQNVIDADLSNKKSLISNELLDCASANFDNDGYFDNDNSMNMYTHRSEIDSEIDEYFQAMSEDIQNQIDNELQEKIDNELQEQIDRQFELELEKYHLEDQQQQWKRQEEICASEQMIQSKMNVLQHNMNLLFLSEVPEIDGLNNQGHQENLASKFKWDQTDKFGIGKLLNKTLTQK